MSAASLDGAAAAIQTRRAEASRWAVRDRDDGGPCMPYAAFHHVKHLLLVVDGKGSGGISLREPHTGNAVSESAVTQRHHRSAAAVASPRSSSW